MTTSVPCRTWTEAQIAALSPGDIAQLNYDEMFELVNAARPIGTGLDAPQVTESDILVRCVYALRQRCRNQTNCTT